MNKAQFTIESNRIMDDCTYEHQQHQRQHIENPDKTSSICSNSIGNNLFDFTGNITEAVQVKSHSKKISTEANAMGKGPNKNNGADELHENASMIYQSSELKSHLKKISSDNSQDKGLLVEVNNTIIAPTTTTITTATSSNPTATTTINAMTTNTKSYYPKPSKPNNLDEKIIEKIKSKVKAKANPSATSTGTYTAINSCSETAKKCIANIFKTAKNEAEKGSKNEPIVERNVKVSEGNDNNQDHLDERKIRSTSFSIPFYASSPIIFDFKDAEIYADGHETKGGSTTFNQTCMQKADEIDESPQRFTPELDALLIDTETPFSTPRVETSLGFSMSNTRQPQAISSTNNSFKIDDINSNLLGDWIWKQTPTKTGLIADSSKPNLSLLSNESTIDNSDSLTINTGEFNNYSFTTQFSGNSTNYKNSGKFDFSSPSRIETARYMQEQGVYDHRSNINGPHYLALPQNNIDNFNISAQKLKQIFPNAPLSLNHSCINFYPRNSLSDLNSSFSVNNEDLSTFANNFNTPQSQLRQQNMVSQQLYTTASANTMMDSYYMHSNQGMGIMKMSNVADNLLYNQASNVFSTTYGDNFKSGNTNQLSQQLGPISHRSNDGSRLDKRKNYENNTDDFSLIFDIDVNKLDDPKRTTLMIKNIPNKYDRSLILQTIDKNHKGKYDFFYLPIDFRNRCNVGYAFINFIDIKFIKAFYDEFNGKRWEKFNSEKICVLKYARIQGRTALIQHFQFSSVMNQQDKKLKPLILPNQGLSNIEQLVKIQRDKIEKNLQRNQRMMLP